METDKEQAARARRSRGRAESGPLFYHGGEWCKDLLGCDRSVTLHLGENGDVIAIDYNGRLYELAKLTVKAEVSE